MGLRTWFQRRPPWIKTVVIGTGVLVGVGLVLIAVGTWMVETAFSPRHMCGSRGSYNLISPDGQYRAVLYEFDCGATTDFATDLAVQPISRKFDPFEIPDEEDVLTADSDHGATGVDGKGILFVHVAWKDERTLQVTLPIAARISKKNTRSGPVTIEYLTSK